MIVIGCLIISKPDVSDLHADEGTRIHVSDFTRLCLADPANLKANTLLESLDYLYNI